MNWLWWMQIAADALLLLVVLALLLRLRKVGELPKPATPEDLESFISEAERLSKEFDRLLGEKRQLITTTLNSLDERISHLNGMLERTEEDAPSLASPRPPRREAIQLLENGPAAAPAPPPPAPAPEILLLDQAVEESKPSDFRSLVGQLAREGKSAAEIAKLTNRPRGEVELVMGLNYSSAR
ncbi:MAG: hypothetical protein KQJ78_00405 [Deltaproteobacteria bacterium]|nr:hypothetical protein [Deltaproteobacteria bacterium]